MKTKSIFKIIILLVIILAFFLFNKYELGQYLNLDFIKTNKQVFDEYYKNQPFNTIVAFFTVYIFIAALSIPGVTILTVLAGSLFGLMNGTILVSFASTVGASLAFLVCRFLLRETVERKFPSVLKKINHGIRQQGNYYLFTLRLVPLFPFFVINAVVSLTKMRLFSFYWVSQIGMLVGTVVYVNVGVQLVQIKTLEDVLSLKLIFSFILLACFPFVIKSLLARYQNRKLYKSYKKPSKFDYNLVVIGAGSGGLVASYIAATVKAKVALVEKNQMGGDCLNTGCVPSKALIRSAKVVQEMKKAKTMGIEKVSYKVNFSKVMKGVHEVIKKIQPHDSVERYSKLGVECIHDEAVILSPWKVELKKQKRTITARSLIIATGASPFIPAIPGLDKIKYLNSDNVWNLKNLPKRLLVLGGGAIGCELAQSFQRLGSNVTQVEMHRLMGIEDPEVSSFIEKKLKSEGVNVLCNHQAISFEVKAGKKSLLIKNLSTEKTRKIDFDEVLIATGRKANLTGYGLENLRIAIRRNGTIAANEFLETNYPNIYVCGDITGPYQLTHAASHQAWFASVNALFGKFKKFKVDYSVLPWCTYVDPEVATVGMNETKAKQEKIEYEVSTYGIDDLDRAIADRSDEGFIKVITAKDSDKILGVTVVGQQASLLILEFVAAMKNGFGLKKILSTIHLYPSLGEANKYVAGNWRKTKINPRHMAWLAKLHNWMRN